MPLLRHGLWNHYPDGSRYHPGRERSATSRLAIELHRLSSISLDGHLAASHAGDIRILTQLTGSQTEQVPNRPKTLADSIGPHHHYIEQPVVRSDAGPKLHKGRNDLATVCDQDHGGIRLIGNAVDCDRVQRATELRHQTQRGCGIGGHSPASLVL